MSPTRDAWNEFGPLFTAPSTEEYPEVTLEGLSMTSVALIYALVRSNSTPASANAVFWSRSRRENVLLDATPNAAMLVARGDAPAFHFLVTQVRFDGHAIPDLGVFVHPEAIQLDYRTGPEWSADGLWGLVALLRAATTLAPEAELLWDPRCGGEESPSLASQLIQRFSEQLRELIRERMDP